MTPFSGQLFELDERRVVERIKDFIKNEKPGFNINVMLRNGRILDILNYPPMVDSGKINPQDAYVYILIGLALWNATFHYPFLDWYDNFLDVYLSKLGFYNWGVPATGLKYIAAVNVYDLKSYGRYLSIEVANLDTVVDNTNLRKIVFEVVGGKLVSGEKELTREEYNKILDIFESQRLFAGYNYGKAYEILRDYYDKGNKSLVKEAARIVIAYVDIFDPYRVCYDMDSWDEVDCSTIR